MEKIISSEKILQPHPFPMIRSGGLFVIFIGLGIVGGAMLGENHLIVSLIGGACVAFAALSIFRNRLVRPLGVPTRFQTRTLIGAIVLEFVLTAIVAYQFQFDQSRAFWLWILLVVGIHFLIIALAQGKWSFVLGTLCITNAAVGLFLPDVPLVVFWFIDGLLKITIGAWRLSTKPSNP